MIDAWAKEIIGLLLGQNSKLLNFKVLETHQGDWFCFKCFNNFTLNFELLSLNPVQSFAIHVMIQPV